MPLIKVALPAEVAGRSDEGRRIGFELERLELSLTGAGEVAALLQYVVRRAEVSMTGNESAPGPDSTGGGFAFVPSSGTAPLPQRRGTQQGGRSLPHVNQRPQPHCALAGRSRHPGSTKCYSTVESCRRRAFRCPPPGGKPVAAIRCRTSLGLDRSAASVRKSGPKCGMWTVRRPAYSANREGPVATWGRRVPRAGRHDRWTQPAPVAWLPAGGGGADQPGRPARQKDQSCGTTRMRGLRESHWLRVRRARARLRPRGSLSRRCFDSQGWCRGRRRSWAQWTRRAGAFPPPHAPRPKTRICGRARHGAGAVRGGWVRACAQGRIPPAALRRESEQLAVEWRRGVAVFHARGRHDRWNPTMPPSSTSGRRRGFVSHP